MPCRCVYAWWRHQVETFSAFPALCEGNSPVTGEFPSQRPVTQGFGVFFDLRLNKRFSKQSRLRWFEKPSRSWWRHYNYVFISRPRQNGCRFTDDIFTLIFLHKNCCISNHISLRSVPRHRKCGWIIIYQDDVIKWKHFPRYWPFVRGIHRWIPRTKASDAELWCFLWCAPE